MTFINCLQINLNHCKAATSQAAIYIKEQAIDIALIQDPYCENGNLFGFPTAWVRHASQDKGAWVIIATTQIIYSLQSPMETAVFVTLTTQKGFLHIGSQYARPSAILEENLVEWELHAQQTQNQPLIVGADLNAHSQQWGYDSDDARGRILIDHLIQNGLAIVNDEDSPPTYEASGGKGWPDVTIVNAEASGLLHQWRVDDTPSSSDHKYIRYAIGTQVLAIQPRRYRTEFGNHYKFRKEFKKHAHVINSRIKEVRTSENLDDVTSSLIQTIQECCELAYKKKSVAKKTNFRWWSPELASERNRLKALSRRCKLLSQEEKIVKLVELKRARAAYKKNLNKAKSQSWKEFCSRQTTKFGVAFKMAHGKLFRPPEIMANWGDDAFHDRQEAMLNLTKYHFDEQEQLQEQRQDKYTIDRAARHHEPHFTLKEVKNALYSMNINKAPGPDNIDFRVLRQVFISKPLLLLNWVNRCAEIGHFPTQLKIGEVVYFNKIGKDPASPDSYRPICLLPTLGKLLEKLIQKRLVYHLENNHYLSDGQYGFREGRSTEDAIENVLDVIRANKEEGYLTMAISLDIKGAFDTVSWRRIKEQLKKVQCPSIIHKLLVSYLNERSIEINWGAGNIRHKVFKGCPQGSCLGPVLWLLVAENFLQQPREDNTQSLAYADDFILLIKGKHRRQLEALGQKALDNFMAWTHQEGLKVSASKSSLIVFTLTQKKMIRQPTIKAGINSVRATNQLKYLGVTLDRTLSWIPHINSLATKAEKLHYSLVRTTGKNWGIKGSLLKEWYKSVPERIFCYAAGTWATHLKVKERKKLITLQRPFLIRITRAYRTTSNAALSVLAGIPPLHLTVEKEGLQAKLLRLRKSIVTGREKFEPKHFQLNNPTWYRHPSKRYLAALENTKSIPTPSNVNIFTDGSKTDKGIASAMVVYQNEQEISSWKGRLGNENTVFQAELLAISRAVTWSKLSLNKSNSIAIYSDSLSSLQALQAAEQKNPQVQKIQTDIAECQKIGHKLRLYWVPAHTGITGNERADQLAKEGTMLPDISDPQLLPPSYLKKELHAELIKKWQVMWDSVSQGRRTHEFLPKVKIDRLSPHPGVTAILTGHGPFPSYRNKFHFISSPYCVCGEEGTEDHYVLNCPLTETWHFRNPAPEAKRSWAESLINIQSLSKKANNLYFWLLANKESVQSAA